MGRWLDCQHAICRSKPEPLDRVQFTTHDEKYFKTRLLPGFLLANMLPILLVRAARLGLMAKILERDNAVAAQIIGADEEAALFHIGKQPTSTAR